jgi:hypothetical protein
MVAACALLGSLLLSSCGIVLLPVGGGTVTACPAGSWQVSSAAVSSLVATVAGKVDVTLQGTGVTATVKSDNTWSLTADQGATVSGTTQWGAVSGTARVKATASGTYTRTSTTMTFTVKALTGNVTYNLTVNGQPYAGTLSLPGTNADDRDLEIEDLYGLVGTASYTCGTDGTLSLQFPAFKLKFKR